MQAATGLGVALALIDHGAGQLLLLLALVLIFIGARKFPGLLPGFRRATCEFRDTTRNLKAAIDDEASEAGRSVGAIYGKPAAQALTPDNHVAELYDPSAFKRETPPRKLRHGLRRFWRGLLLLLRAIRGNL